MARTDALEMGELTDTAYYIVLSLAEPKHGYLIMKTIEELTGGRFSIGPASMYTTIKKLEAAGLIRLLDEKNDNKKTYAATEQGISLLRNEMERRREMVLHAENVLKKKGEQANGEV